MARRSVWSDARVRELVANFLPVADEVGRLQRGKDPECVHFQKMAEEGHYKGRVRPSNTRQGIYATAPSGVFLASVNTRRPKAVAEMLERALEKWRTLSPEERRLAEDPARLQSKIERHEAKYPRGGLVLRVNSRDLPRPQAETRPARDWRQKAWNRDYAWFRRDEARRFLPTKLAVGETHDVPRPLVSRLVCLHFVDNVRGQTHPFSPEDMREATITTRIRSIEGDRVSLALHGASHTERSGRWTVNGFKDRGEPSKQTRGFRAQLQGRAVWDRAENRFVSFDLVAIGDRWGGTTYNARADDLASAPMGVALTLAGPKEKVAPAWIWRYRW